MQAPDMIEWLTRLVGQTIPTMTGRPNRILRVNDGIVWVGTGRSPHGEPVKINVIQDAADRLFARGELEVSVPSVGYRSAFVGAVLSTLPGTIVQTRPRRIRVSGHSVDKVP